MENNSNISNQHRLSIRFSSDGFSLYIHDESNKLISSKEISCSTFAITKKEIINLLSNETETLHEFKKIELICESSVYTSIPSTFFNAENASDFLKFQFKKGEIESIICNTIPTIDNVIIFSIPKALHNALEAHFGNISIIHHLTHLLLKEISGTKENIVHIQIRSTFFDAIVETNGKIQLINSFAYNSNEDICYYILNIFEKLSLDSETCQVKLYNAKNKLNLKILLEKYIKNCFLVN